MRARVHVTLRVQVRYPTHVCEHLCVYKYVGVLVDVCAHTGTVRNVCVGLCLGEGTVKARATRVRVLRQEGRAGDAAWMFWGDAGCLPVLRWAPRALGGGG